MTKKEEMLSKLLEQAQQDIKIWKELYTKDTHTLQNQLDIANADRVEKDKIIKLMAGAICYEPLPTEEYCVFRNFNCPVVGGDRDCRECAIQYFQKEVRNKI